MKRFLLIFSLLAITFISQSQKKWDGGALTSNWNDAANWYPDGVPIATDNVLLDNSLYASSYTVNLPSGAVTVAINTLTITPAVTSSITLILPVSNTADPGLDITATSDALILNNGAVLKNSSGALSGSGISITDTFRINNGGHYIHNTNRGNAVIIDHLSHASGTELGEFEFDDPSGSTTVSLTGNTFGTLTLSAITSGSASYIGNGASVCNIRGHLNINAGASFSIGMSADLIISRDYNQAASSTFSLQNSNHNNFVKIAGNLSIAGAMIESGSGIPTLELNGTSIQNITVTGSINDTIDFKINNTAGATLLSNLTLPYRYTITSGNIILNDYDFITLAINQVNAATLTSNHIVTNGTGALTIKSIGTGPVDFPVGPSADSLNTLTVTNGGGKDYSLRINKGLVPSIAFPTYGINRTWNLKASSVTQGVTLAFQYVASDVNPGANPPSQAMEILEYSGVAWSIINPNITPTGSYWVTSTLSLTIPNTFTPYAIGKNGGWALPLDYIISCRAQKKDNTGVINWTVNSCAEVNSFEVQRSVNNSGFRTIGTVNPVVNQTEFRFTDAALSNGTNLYRIKVNRFTGSIKYSNTVSLVHNCNEILILSLAPNPVHNMLKITVSTGRQSNVDFKVHNMTGSLVKQWHSNIAEGNNTIEMNMEELPAGVYTLFVSAKDANAVSRFIRQ